MLGRMAALAVTLTWPAVARADDAVIAPGASGEAVAPSPTGSERVAASYTRFGINALVGNNFASPPRPSFDLLAGGRVGYGFAIGGSFYAIPGASITVTTKGFMSITPSLRIAWGAGSVAPFVEVGGGGAVDFGAGSQPFAMLSHASIGCTIHPVSSPIGYGIAAIHERAVAGARTELLGLALVLTR